MKCMICNRPDAKEIDRVLLCKAALRSGIISTLAKRVGCSRQVLWNHRKKHLGMKMARQAPRAGVSLEEKAAILSSEAARLQQLAECQMESAPFERALRALNVRMRLLQLEGQLAGRLSGGKGKSLGEMLSETPLEEDPAEEERARQEYQEIVGSEQ